MESDSPLPLAADGHQPPRLDVPEHLSQENFDDLHRRCSQTLADLSALRAEHQRVTAELQKLASHVRALFPMDSSQPGLGHEASFIIHTTNHLSDSRQAALRRAEAAEATLAAMTSSCEVQQIAIGRLNAALASALERVAAWRADNEIHVTAWRQAEAEVARLSEALKTYGQHKEECRLIQDYSKKPWPDVLGCDCGFAAVLHETTTK